MNRSSAIAAKVHAGTSHMGELVERISLGRTPLRPEEASPGAHRVARL